MEVRNRTDSDCSRNTGTVDLKQQFFTKYYIDESFRAMYHIHK